MRDIFDDDNLLVLFFNLIDEPDPRDRREPVRQGEAARHPSPRLRRRRRAADAPPRATVPGVLIEALATRMLLKDSAPEPLSRRMAFGVSAILFLALGLVFFRAQPVIGALLLAAAAGAAWLASALALSAGVVLPMLPLLIGGALMFTAVYCYRTFLEDHEKRWIRHAFQHYLSPALVDKLAADPSSLRLGGERRRAAVLFVDMAGFSTLANALVDEPQTLAAELNAFLSAVADAIDANDGYVDKFIGDAVIDVWGTPIDTGEIEASAARRSGSAFPQGMSSMRATRKSRAIATPCASAISHARRTFSSRTR